MQDRMVQLLYGAPRPTHCKFAKSSVQGLWVVHAPGEAEATCAALNRAGHVHGCATNDGDALLFGAETLFHTLKLVVGPLCLVLCHHICTCLRWTA